MNTEYFKSLPPDERLKVLRDNADFTEDHFSYTKTLTDEELREYERNLGKSVISLDHLEQRKRDFMDELKEEMKPLKNELKELTGIIRRKAIDKTETVYCIKDWESMKVLYYNAAGDLIIQRNMSPAERQTSMIVELQKTA